MAPEDFVKSFALAFAARDAAGIAALMAEDGQGLTLSGIWVEGRNAVQSAWAAEFAGVLARARLVTGRGGLRPLGPGATVIHQRFVLIGAQAASGAELAHFSTVLSAVLLARATGWQALVLHLLPLGDEASFHL